MSSPPISSHCAACDRAFVPGPDLPLPFACACPPNGYDRVLTPRVAPPSPGWRPDDDPQPFVAWRRLLGSHALAVRHGLGDAWYVDTVRRLDAAVAAVDGAGFRQTPTAPVDVLPGVEVWAKDETGHVAGSHKARHLFGVLLHLEVARALGWIDAIPPLAIASCGNAALAAAVLARAAEQPLTVFIPPDAHASVVARLEELGATIQVCHRQPGEAGDPCYLRFLEAVAAGAAPFCCQGTANGLTLEGGQTLAFELAASLGDRALDHLVVQVGGGAFGSAVVLGLRTLLDLGLLPAMPRIHTVQTQGAAPLKRAYDRVKARAAAEGVEPALRHAATHKADYMWPWESAPQSVATGILDDETYDWWWLCAGMLRTGGEAVVADEDTLRDARVRAHAAGVRASHTGAAGLAGLMTLHAHDQVAPGARAAVVFSGVER